MGNMLRVSVFSLSFLRLSMFTYLLLKWVRNTPADTADPWSQRQGLSSGKNVYVNCGEENL